MPCLEEEERLPLSQKVTVWLPRVWDLFLPHPLGVGTPITVWGWVVHVCVCVFTTRGELSAAAQTY